MTTKKQDTGKLGEDIAVKYLEKHGYEIVERNYRKPWGEIDIVARETTGQIQELIFIEVKAQNINFEWRPEENVGFHKKRQLSKIVATYLKEHRISESQDWRIDVLALKLDFETKNAQVEHIKNIMLN
ncbi:MAG: YraN family protein [Candidatus Azambacteria bacterium]|nr:YraN family protein [Candidatus Azambacteria bacterium]